MTRIGDPVSECSICGLDFFESEMSKHYKTGRLVDALCADEPGASDYLEKMRRPVEKQKRSKQPAQQGYVATDWATISIAASFEATAEVIGDNRAGIITVVGGTDDEHVNILTVTYGTSLVTSPSTVIITPYSPTAQKPSMGVPSFSSTGFNVHVIGIEAHVTYQWRYEVR